MNEARKTPNAKIWEKRGERVSQHKQKLTKWWIEFSSLKIANRCQWNICFIKHQFYRFWFFYFVWSFSGSLQDSGLVLVFPSIISQPFDCLTAKLSIHTFESSTIKAPSLILNRNSFSFQFYLAHQRTFDQWRHFKKKLNRKCSQAAEIKVFQYESVFQLQQFANE